MCAVRRFKVRNKKTNMRTPVKATLKYWKKRTLSIFHLSEIYRLRLSRRDKYIKRLETENANLRSIIEPEKVSRHHYPAQMVAMAVFIVVRGGSLRLAAAAAGFYAEMMGWSYNTPSHVTIRNWVLRCGFSVLEAGKDLTGDFTVIFDETVQIGKEKLLLMLGVPNSMHQTQCGELRHEDVHVLGMSVRTSWTGQAVCDFVKERVEDLGINLTKIISDRGTNLLKACKLLKVPHIGDCSHHMMNGVKAIFKDDAELSKLCAEIGKLRTRLCMTDYAYLLPPTLRDKDRFCRMFQLVDWIDRIKLYTKNDEEGVKEYLSFLIGTEQLILRLRQVRSLVEISGEILRRSGLSEAARILWEQRTAEYLKSQTQVTQAAHVFIKHMRLYFELHKPLMETGQRWLCCSEVIESIFGRYKNKGGMKAISADILAIPLYGQKISVAWVKNAMEKTLLNNVENWEAEQVCMNRYGILHQLRNRQKHCTAVDN